MSALRNCFGYLSASRVEHGVLINFGAPKFQIRKFALRDASRPNEEEVSASFSFEPLRLFAAILNLRASRVEHGVLINFGAPKFHIPKFALRDASVNEEEVSASNLPF